MKTFAELFKKYRLRAEFASLSDFANAFAEKGYVYDISILSQWQNGKRIPTKRDVMIAIIEVFIQNLAITTLDQANEFLESAGHGYLTHREQTKMMFNNHQITQNTFLID